MYRAGEILGEYRLQTPLGDGALGVVWEAHRVDADGRRAALKLLNLDRVPEPVRAAAFDQLTRALTAVGRLEHPGLQALQGTALRPEDGAFGLAARFYEGGPFQNLGNLARPGTLAQALGLLRQLVDTLGWLHERGLTHGSVKPSNVLITPAPSGRRVVLLDLCWSRAGLSRRTDASRVFVSPEQLAKQPGGPASDQWSAARLLHQLAVHASPGRSQTEALTALPVPVLRVLKRALEQDPRNRFASMGSFSQALEHAQDELGAAGGSAPALPTPTLEVSAADAVAVTEDPTWRGPHAGLEEDDTLQPTPAVADVPASADPSIVVSEAPTPRAMPPAAAPPATGPAPARDDPDEADPSADRGDPTTPVSLKGINPSDEREVGSARPIRPSDPTDVLPSVQPASGGAGKRLGVVLAIAAVVLGAVGAALWAQRQSEPVEIEVAAAPEAAAAPEPDPEPPPEPAPAHPPEPAGAPPPKPAAAPPPEPAPAPSPKPVLASAKATLPVPEKDPREAACQRGRRSACLALADAYRSGDGVPRSTARARRYYAQACRLRSIRACEVAGALYASADPRQARRYLERACDAGRGAPCAGLAELWRRGEGGAKNDRTATAFDRRACEFGHTPSCR